MKPTFFIAAIALGFTVCVQAQASFNPGIRAGVNFSKLTQAEADFKTGFYISAFGSLNLGRFYALQPELGYTNQGATNLEATYHDDQQGGTVTRDVDVDISYVSIAIANKFKFSEAFHFQLGPILDIEAGNSPHTNVPLDIAFMAGFGIEFTQGFGLEARVKKGIVDVFDYDEYYPTTDNDYITNFLFQVGLSYAFDMK